MARSKAEEFVLTFFRCVLRSEVKPSDIRKLVRAVGHLADDPAALLDALVAQPEVLRRLGVQSRWAGGHYYSPVVDPAAVADYVRRERTRPVGEVAGIPLDVAAMRALWLEQLDFVQSSPFGEDPADGIRFRMRGSPYPMGDAIVLRMMIRKLRPRRIIEIGSGFTTACILDSIGHAGLSDVALTCIDPYADRMRSLLFPGDLERLTLIERPIQDVPVEIVDDLDRNDMLLIDSTHVLKTGSDVHHEFFHLLPRLRPGVMVHFHDIMPGFEYPDQWVLEQNYSWNEAYGLRAFLMYNQDFRVRFWGALLARAHRAELRREMPAIFPNPGSAIWIERVARNG